MSEFIVIIYYHISSKNKYIPIFQLLTNCHK